MSRRITPWCDGGAPGMFFCPVCGNGPLSIEEIDFETCDACGGEGFEDQDGSDFLGEFDED